MAKWRCEICGNEFENFHAQGFDNKIYCPLCYFKKENQELKEKLDKYENPEDMTLFAMWCTEKVKEENERLKKKYENSVADYETTMFEKEQLKKQLEENKDNYNCLLKQKEQFEYIMSKQVDYQDQQKEFIKYMNSCIKELEKESPNKLQNTISLAIKDIAKIILQKYKEIIGDDK